MRSGDPGWQTSENGDGGSWKTNNKPGDAWKRYGAWGTPFSCFRFTIPELCGFQGRAVYLDADMLVQADVRELLEMPLTTGYHVAYFNRSDVAVIDCSYFADRRILPAIEQMRPTGFITATYMRRLHDWNAIAVSLPETWNACDRMDGAPDPGTGFKLLHYTVVPTQPYQPYPSVRYYPHPWKSWHDAWHQAHQEALAATRPDRG